MKYLVTFLKTFSFCFITFFIIDRIFDPYGIDWILPLIAAIIAVILEIYDSKIAHNKE